MTHLAADLIVRATTEPVLDLGSGQVVTWAVVAAAVVVYVGVVLALVTDEREPTIVLAWLFVILLVPLIGIVAYFLVGRDHRRARGRRNAARQARDTRAAARMAPTLEANHAFTEATSARLVHSFDRRIELVGRHEGGMVPLPADEVRLYFAGADKFRDLLEDLRSARHHIHLMYLIWEMDRLTAEVTEVLLDRIAAGVEVRIIYDWLSSLPYKKDELKRLATAGATVVPCYKDVAHLNYRNHMKMAIIDSRVIYSGGMNMGQEYIDGGKRYDRWRDTHFRMTGPVVAPYLSLFASTWEQNGRDEDVFGHAGPPPEPRSPGRGVPVQVLHSSVSTQFPTLRDVFVTALANAERRAWVQSPYFVPDEPLLTAMCVAAASGIDVRFMMTGHPDKKVPFYAAQAYYPRLLASGVRVFQYRAGFLHAKTVTVDDDVAIIGTCNFDIRSLILHDEVVAVCYDPQIAARNAREYEQDLAECLEVTPAWLAELGSTARLRNSVCRLLSRLL
jgi:cardiolipin synthase